MSSEGNFHEALSASRAITDHARRSSCLASVARAQGSLGDRPGARRSIAEGLDAARRIVDEEDRAVMLATLCDVQIAID